MTLCSRVVQDEVDVVERHDPRQPLGEILEQSCQIAMRGDRLGHLQKQAPSIAFAAQLQLGFRQAILHVQDRFLRISHCALDGLDARSAVEVSSNKNVCSVSVFVLETRRRMLHLRCF